MKTRPTYTEMVKTLFKPLPTIGEVAHHATTGISGEVGELAEATDRTNILEECGDLEFYLEALFQVCGRYDPDDGAYLRPGFYLGTVIHYMGITASHLLDLTKKSWIYQKPLPTDQLFYEAFDLRAQLDTLYSFLGTTMEEVQALNIDKLLVRYEGMVYSDEAARNRADKTL